MRVDALGDAQLLELAPHEPRRLGPRVRDDREAQPAVAQRLEQRVRGVDERARRAPRVVLGVEEAVELVVGDVAEQRRAARPA